MCVSWSKEKGQRARTAKGEEQSLSGQGVAKCLARSRRSSAPAPRRLEECGQPRQTQDGSPESRTEIVVGAFVVVRDERLDQTGLVERFAPTVRREALRRPSFSGPRLASTTQQVANTRRSPVTSPRVESAFYWRVDGQSHKLGWSRDCATGTVMLRNFVDSEWLMPVAQATPGNKSRSCIR